MGRLIYKGAEANIFRGRWQRLESIFKVRKPLTYRLETLDKSIRRQRTLREAEAMHAARRAGVMVPRLYYLDLSETTLVMEYIDGVRVKDSLARASPGQIGKTFKEIGEDVARLHSRGIMHGDLTTANLVKCDKDLVFLDFGLSVHTSRVEDQAVDLRLMKEALFGAHSAVAKTAMESLIFGYSVIAGKACTKAVTGQLRNIERRGRYARVD